MGGGVTLGRGRGGGRGREMMLGAEVVVVLRKCMLSKPIPVCVLHKTSIPLTEPQTDTHYLAQGGKFLLRVVHAQIRVHHLDGNL